ncbi:TonB-dependent siderophore receptor [Myroides marinus]|uniref:TonB-dependent siderophore receptor n=1 Tax=Myroides marinus TaxID=703342 RepID=UPI002574AB36|nr:TonB-dependent siderophore receptor [Myroides marinus]MDM1353744.1 TonB-dependent siderophore receptor [Myroides marinus]
MKRILLILTAPCYLVSYAQQPDSLVNQKINEVVITATQHHKEYSSKMPLTFLETPQSADVITDRTFKEQVSTNIKDVLQNATGLVRLWESTNVGITGGEYYSMRGFAFQPNLLNGMASYNNGSLDIANIEQVEVIKGPNGTLYGGTVISYGGLINVITKKPYETFGGDINYITGSNGLHRASIDINTPISKKLFFRLNTAYHKQNSFKDAGYNESFFVAPSIQYNASDNVKLYLDLQYKEAEAANVPMLFLNRTVPLTFNSIDLFEQNYKKSYTSNELIAKNPTLNIQGRIEYKLTDNWVSNTIIAKNTTRSSGYDQFLNDMANGDEFVRYISTLDSKTDIINIQHNLTGEFKIGSFDNKFVWGLDYLSKKLSNTDSDYIDHGIISLVHQTDSGILTREAVDNTLKGANKSHRTPKTETFSSYLSNVTNFLPNLSLMMSLRVDHLKGQTSSFTEEKNYETSFSPKFGLVYQPIQDKLAVFANYLNGFVFLDPAIVSDPDGTNKSIQPFDPEQANQFEIGSKANLLNGRLTAAVSYYHINVSNKLMSDMENMNGFSQGGKVKSKGVELTLSGSPLIGWNIITGFSHNYNKVTKSLPEDGNLGTRPEEAGPANTFNFWTNYQVQSGTFKNLSLGFGINSLSSLRVMNRTTIGVFEIPSYTIMNAAVSYSYKNATASLKLDNLTNKKYFSGNSTVNAQGERAISLSVNYRL